MEVCSADLVPSGLRLESSCVALGKSLNLSVLQFPPLKNGDTLNTCLTADPAAAARIRQATSSHLPRARWVSSDAFCQACGRALHA